MVKLEDFKANALEKGICDEYIELWNKCINRKDIIDMTLSVKAIDYLCDAIAKGWGISSQEIVRKFSPYINGKYVCSNAKGYTCELCCQLNGSFLCKTTLLGVIDSNLVINVPQNHICEIYVVNSNITIVGKGRAIVITYGNYDDVTIDSDCDIHLKRIHKK